MKRLFYLVSGVALLYLFLGGALLVASCSKDSGGDGPEEPDQPKNVMLELSRSDLVFESSGGEKTFTVSCNGTWTIENESDWCTTDFTHGTGNLTVTVTAAVYSGMEDRNMNLTIKAGDKTQVLGVTQKGKDAIIVSKDKFEVPQEGVTISVEVKSNISYEVTIPEEFGSWIAPSPRSRAVTKASYEFVISKNSSKKPREGYILFAGNSVQDTVRIYQADRLVLTDPTCYVSHEGGEITVELKTNVNYDVQIPTSVASWISRVETRTLRTDRIHFSVSENRGRDVREALVVVKDRNSKLSDTLRVCQYGKGLIVSQQNYFVPRAGKTISVEVKGGIEYGVTIPSAFQSWIASAGGTSSSLSDVTPKTYRFAVSELEGNEEREGYIVFSGNSLTDTVYIYQGGDFTETIKGVSFDMLYVEGGTFMMGATEEQGDDAYDSEKPVHSVTLSDYYIGKFEVTQGLWKAIMDNNNPSNFQNGDDYPMYYVNWEEAQEFCKKLSQLTGKTYVLPTEAQWEYAARGGVKSRGYKYSGSNTIGNVAWYGDNSSSSTHPVATKQPNELGLYDMSGNVWEWCSDWYGYYSSESQSNPTGPSTGSYRVVRGGSWHDFARRCRVSHRNGINRSLRGSNYGFRVVLLL
ncbi:MAG: SUMF1/EgtB/PvdO family nonheme iron enzyme [Odoribacter sp.]|nr:SUMF1/EgtB/PvdO family nonheme iron enzyme [Odoribacter sp.]